MEKDALRYARWVLIGHLALVALLMLIVAGAVRVLYNGARGQAIQSATQTQELLARQTALGIQNYYGTVISVLEMFQPSENEPQPPALPENPTPRQRQARRELRERFLASARLNQIADPLWNSIRQKVQLLLVIDPADSIVVVKVIGSDPSAPAPQAVIDSAKDWLKTVTKPSVSPYLRFGADRTGGAHLVAVPLRGPGGFLMVAAVPVSHLERDILASVNRSSMTGAMLVDDSGRFVSATQAGVVGRHYSEFDDPRTRKLAERYVTLGAAGSEVFDSHEVIGQVTLKPGMLTIQPINVLDKRWFVTIGSDLAEVDNFVKPVFKDAMLWAAFVMLAMTAILVSTAVQMIRSRIRIERIRNELVHRELQQAREIQLAWLPDNDDDPPQIDLSAVNQPASHISGDFYNWFQLSDGRTVVVIGDVTGHGMAAAFLMATTQLLVRTTMPRLVDPGACLAEVNRQLCVQVFNGQFVTMLIMVLDLEHGTIDLATAGHPPPLVAQGGPEFVELPVEPQLILGIERDVIYRTQRFKLSRGAALLLYTDGVVDALSPAGTRFGVAGIQQCLYGRFDTAQAIIDQVVDSVTTFRATHELTDDLTLVAVQLQPASLNVTQSLAATAT